MVPGRGHRRGRGNRLPETSGSMAPCIESARSKPVAARRDGRRSVLATRVRAPWDMRRPADLLATVTPASLAFPPHGPFRRWSTVLPPTRSRSHGPIAIPGGSPYLPGRPRAILLSPPDPRSRGHGPSPSLRPGWTPSGPVGVATGRPGNSPPSNRCCAPVRWTGTTTRCSGPRRR
jgi:hypothetical protein